jgi:hypothetical protein
VNIRILHSTLPPHHKSAGQFDMTWAMMEFGFIWGHQVCMTGCKTLLAFDEKIYTALEFFLFVALFCSFGN